MTNEQIILNEAAKLDPATLHAIAFALSRRTVSHFTEA